MSPIGEFAAWKILLYLPIALATEIDWTVEVTLDFTSLRAEAAISVDFALAINVEPHAKLFPVKFDVFLSSRICKEIRNAIIKTGKYYWFNSQPLRRRRRRANNHAQPSAILTFKKLSL